MREGAERRVGSIQIFKRTTTTTSDGKSMSLQSSTLCLVSMTTQAWAGGWTPSTRNGTVAGEDREPGEASLSADTFIKKVFWFENIS